MIRTRHLWMVHLATLLAATVWSMLDLRFGTTLDVFNLPVLISSATSGSVNDDIAASPMGTFAGAADQVGLVRTIAFFLVVMIASATLLALCLRLLIRRQLHSRSITTLLSVCAVTALWCSAIVNQEALAWHGSRLCIAAQFSDLESIADPLRHDWPESDGDLDGVGPFMAYPFGRPTTLILLHSRPILGDQLCIAAVERCQQGAVKLQLDGTGHDDWAEWHPRGSQPESFVGGLGDPHQLESTATLGRGWHLVRYRAKDSLGQNQLALAGAL